MLGIWLGLAGRQGGGKVAGELERRLGVVFRRIPLSSDLPPLFSLIIYILGTRERKLLV